MSAVLCADIGGTYVRVGVVDGAFQIFGFNTVKREDILSTGEKGLAGFLRHVMTLSALSAEAVVIGIPGTVSRDRRRILNCPNAPELETPALVDALERELRLAVFLERDVNLLLLRDMREFGSDGLSVGIYFGTGLGNAIALDGETLVGHDGVAGELGHIPAMGKTERCTCGNQGCLENYASGRALERLTSEHFPGTHIGEVFTRHAGHPVIRDFIGALAVAVATEINVLNPDRVVLGGGVPQMPDFPKEMLIEMIKSHVRKPLPCDTLKLHFSQPSQQSGLLGAAIYGSNKLGKQEKGGVHS